MHKINSVIKAVTKSPKQDIFIPSKYEKKRDHLFSVFSEILNQLDKPVVPIRIVLNPSITSTAEEALDFILDRMIIDLSEKNVLVEKPDELGAMPDKRGATNFIENAKSIVKLSRTRLSNIRIVLLIDNIDCLLIKEQNFVDNMPIKLLNGLLQSDMGNNISAIFGGEFSESKISEQKIYSLFRNFKWLSV